MNSYYLNCQKLKLKQPTIIPQNIYARVLFSFADKGSEYLIALLERLRDVSSLNATELISNRSSALRCHSVKWSDTTESCFGFPGEEQLVDTPYQFSISSNQYGRVHGFFIEEVFYIVWLDPDHKLYL